MALTAYREGASTLANILEARRTSRELLAQYVDDLAAAWIATAELRALAVFHFEFTAMSNLFIERTARSRRHAHRSRRRMSQGRRGAIRLRSSRRSAPRPSSLSPQPFTETLGAIGTVTPRVGPRREFERACRGPRRAGARLHGSRGSRRRSADRVGSGAVPRIARSGAGRVRGGAASERAAAASRAGRHRAAQGRRSRRSPIWRGRATICEIARRAENLSIIKAPISGVVTRVVATHRSVGRSVAAAGRDRRPVRRSTSC